MTASVDARPGRWLLTAPGGPGRLRLLCVPHAGCGAAPYLRWQPYLPDGLELTVVALPGREARAGEQPCRSMAELLPPLVAAVRQWRDSSPLPYVLLGHSMGALVAYELAGRLGPGRAPRALVVSGHGAPHLPPEEPLHGLPDEQFVARIVAGGGPAAAPLAEPALRALVLPALRADFVLTETYRAEPVQPLACPLITWAGAQDHSVPAEDVALWAGYSTGPVRHRVFGGDHFFPLTAPGEVLAGLADDLADDLAADLA